MAQKICVFLTCEQLRRDCDAGLVVSRIEDRLGLWKIVLQAHLQRTNGSTFKRFFVKCWDELRQKAFRFVSFRCFLSKEQAPLPHLQAEELPPVLQSTRGPT
eukprot:COSAG06_NODE_669_length_13222_cov_8.235922_1_plen_101_part_10